MGGYFAAIGSFVRRRPCGVRGFGLAVPCSYLAVLRPPWRPVFRASCIVWAYNKYKD